MPGDYSWRWSGIRRWCAVVFSGAFVLAGCGVARVSERPPDLGRPSFYFGEMKAMEIEMAYEPGAEPFGVGRWGLLSANLGALFEGRVLRPQIAIPAVLEDLVKLPVQGRSQWTLFNILDLEKAYRLRRSEGTTGRFWIVFLRGYLEKDGEPDPSVIGVNIMGTSVIAMFKDVIEASGPLADGAVARFVEQSTLVHEMGHALGLVGNGLPLQSSHLDTANGPHCTNPRCVMYWSNTGSEALVRFRIQLQKTEDPVIFGAECLQDARGFQPGNP